ncbi:hypothetical protein LUW76_33795 [Actinomadura madurae]|uniref:hypothetical protein n=1 Tax=Actinomadura madurae TaxID=1993 RepID=UPI002026AF3A|nr:hypothetical protein [Actinomadura madurae]URM98908.1 hypothetical protein LUW76_33795 [Actinomadura madurae]
MTFLMMFIAVSHAAVDAALGTGAPSFLEQVVEASSPLIGMFLFKRISRAAGLGDISTLNGALGFAGAAVMRATGDKSATTVERDGHEPGGPAGAGGARRQLSGLTHEALQRRVIGGAAMLAGNLARPLASRLAGTKRTQAGKGPTTGRRRASATAVGKRAAVHAGLAAMSGALPPSMKGALPLMAGLRSPDADSGSSGRGGAGQGHAGYREGDAAGIAISKDDLTEAQDTSGWYRNIRKVAPGDRKKLEAARISQSLDDQRARQWGAGHPGGLNYDLQGFVHAAELQRGHAELAEAMGLPEDQILVGEHGLAVPVPAGLDQRGRRVFPKGMSLTDKAHPVHWLDRQDLVRQKIGGSEETDDQYIARVVAQVRARGFLTDDGRFVDVFAAHGFDTRQPEVRERVERWLSGGRDEELDRKIKVTARGPEDTVIAAAHDWSREQAEALEWAAAQRAVEVQRLMDAAERDIADFGRIEVQPAAGGAPLSAQEIHDRLKGEIQGAAELANAFRRLYSDKNSYSPADYDRERQELAAAYRARIASADDLAGAFRDAVGLSAAMRDVCELRAAMTDETDLAELEARGARLADKAAGWRKALEHRFDKQIGGVQPVPEDLAQAGEALVALAELRMLVDTHVRNEKESNDSALKRLYKTRRQATDESKAADPRLAAVSPPTARQIVAEHSGPGPGPAENPADEPGSDPRFMKTVPRASDTKKARR